MVPVTPILQFGTSRFLQAHADLFVSEAMERGEALGPITVVQTTASLESAARVAALAGGAGYPVRIRGLLHGRLVDRETRGRAVARALQAERDWPEIRRVAVHEAEIMVSNTGERGYELHAADTADLLGADRPPRSFPAKLAALLHARWSVRPTAPLTMLPCELLSRNGDRLQAIVAGLARDWGLPGEFIAYLSGPVVWGNSLVDRIVAEPIRPIGAVAEPYALWAIERRAGLVLPCRHDAIVLTEDVGRFERLKLWLLNLGHSVLAERWIAEGRPEGRTVLQAMRDPPTRAALEAVWADEVVPVFAAEGQRADATAYIASVTERFENPHLAHRLADIATHHDEKKRRRMAPVVEAAERLGLRLPQAGLRAALATTAADAAPS